MSIEEVRVASPIGDIPTVVEWRGHPLPPSLPTQTRKSLPIYPYREALLEAITEHQVDNCTSVLACALVDSLLPIPPFPSHPLSPPVHYLLYSHRC